MMVYEFWGKHKYKSYLALPATPKRILNHNRRAMYINTRINVPKYTYPLINLVQEISKC